MRIDIETKYNIGQWLYMFSSTPSKIINYQGCIYKVQITAIHIIDENNNYVYETHKGLLLENQLFEKLKDLEQKLKESGYYDIKYIK